METIEGLKEIKPEIDLDSSSNDYKELEEYFSYVIDCVAEIHLTLYLIYKIKDDFLERDNHKGIRKRILFNSIILNICRISEIQKSSRLFNAYYPKYKRELDNIIKKYNMVTDYRNFYLAHPKDKHQTIKTPEERSKMMKKIIGEDEDIFISDMQKLCDDYFSIFMSYKK